MRNLKKILALVLALVMSLSLMATASAKQDFTDASSIDEKYATAVEVLNGLEVFKGYQNGSSYDFQPNGEITRAEVAAIIYRIATGDVKDEQVKIYADYNKFPDVPSTLWSAGYINYCANAEYVKGETNGKFNPEGKVTGYQALAMILRAIGYTANGGFTGPGWDLQTAAVGEARGITKNIVKGTLNENATRQTVAEILFQAILVNMVNFDQRTGYYELGESLGYKIFKLEELEGVVVANEYANLYGTSVLADGKTNLEVAKDDVRTLDLGTKITDIGERRALYTQNTSKVLTFTGDGLNTVKETGAAIEIDTAAKFKTASGMDLVSAGADTTQFFVNFDRTGNYTCDQRIEFNVAFYGARGESNFTAYTGQNVVDLAANDNEWTVERGTFAAATPTTVTWTRVPNNTVPAYNGTTAYRYTKVIAAGRDISDSDLAVIEGIFGIADNVNNNVHADYRISGDVYVGTKSTPSTIIAADERDLSNSISYNTFFEQYINPETYDINWENSGNGEWVKFIDNDNDGKCDYAFLTGYGLDEVVGTHKTKAGDTIMDYNGGYNDDDDEFDGKWHTRYMDGVDTVERNVEVGDIVLTAFIDNQALISKADSVTTQATSYNWRDDQIAAANGETYGQSHVGNWTDMLQLLSTMSAKTNYEMFLDKFGYVRAYRVPGGNQYALVTELYYANNANGSLIKNWPMTAELTMPDENGKAVTKEYSTSSSTPFLALTAWTNTANRVQTSQLQNWLQPAIANLGVTRAGYGPVRYGAGVGAVNGTYWPGWLQLTKNISSMTDSNGNLSTEFNYGAQKYYNNAGVANVDMTNSVSFTNVAIVNIDGESATLNGAAELALNRVGGVGPATNPNSYAVNYIQLDRTKDVVKGAASYTIGGTAAYQRANNYTVSATNDTEIYIVHNDGVEYYKGYANMPKLTNKDNAIHAAYAVARNTSKDNDSTPYWVADVIVYEVHSWSNLAKTSISLAYFTNSQQLQSANGTVIKTLNNKTTPAKVDLIPAGVAWNNTGNWDWNLGQFTGPVDANWGSNWKGYGFYQLYNASDATDGVMSAAKIEYINEKYNKSGIYAGVVTREVATAIQGGYLPVNVTGARNSDGSLKIEDQIPVSENSIYSVTAESQYPINFYEANNLYYNNISSSQVKPGDRVIWVGSSTIDAAVSSASFIVDMGHFNNRNDPALENWDLANKTAPWLTPIYTTIMAEQAKDAETVKITVKVDATAGQPDATVYKEQTIIVKKDATWTIDKAKAWADGGLAIDGYTVDEVTVTGGTAVGMDGNNSFGIAKVEDDTEITVKYKVNTYSLAIAGITDAPAPTVNYEVTKPTSTTADETGTLTIGGAGITSANIVNGASYKITFQGSPLQTYKVTASSALDGTAAISVAADNTVTITGKITGQLVITVTETAKANVLVNSITTSTLTTATVKSNGTAFTPDGTTRVPVGAVLTVEVAAAPGESIKDVSVTYTVDGTSYDAIYDGVSGVWTLTEATVESGVVNIKVDAVNNGTGDLKIVTGTAGTGLAVPDDAYCNYKNNPTLISSTDTNLLGVAAGDEIVVYSDSGKTLDVQASGFGYTKTANADGSRVTITVTNPIDGGTITVLEVVPTP